MAFEIGKKFRAFYLAALAVVTVGLIGCVIIPKTQPGVSMPQPAQAAQTLIVEEVPPTPIVRIRQSRHSPLGPYIVPFYRLETL